MTEQTRFADRQLQNYHDNPNQCPFCHRDNIQAGHFEYGEGGGHVSVWCHKCGFEWDDLYAHVGAGERYFSELEPSKLEDNDPGEGREGCWEFSIQGVGWGVNVEEAWEACKDGIEIDHISADDAHPNLIDDRPLDDMEEESNET